MNFHDNSKQKHCYYYLQWLVLVSLSAETAALMVFVLLIIFFLNIINTNTISHQGWFVIIIPQYMSSYRQHNTTETVASAYEDNFVTSQHKI